MKMSELKDLTLVELSAKGRDLRQEIFNLRLQQASAQLEKPARLRTLRRDIARVETGNRKALVQQKLIINASNYKIVGLTDPTEYPQQRLERGSTVRDCF